MIDFAREYELYDIIIRRSIMVINIRSDEYQKLISLCSQSKLEQNGLIRLEVLNDEIHFLDYYESNGEEIIERTNNCIQYNSKDFVYYQMMTTLLFDPSKEIWVNYHTHPGLLSVNGLSKPDIETLKYRTYLRNKVYKEEFKIEPPIQVEAIITEDEVGFYSIIDDKIIKHNLLIDGKEIKHVENICAKTLKRMLKRITK